MPDPLSTADLFERAADKVHGLYAEQKNGRMDGAAVTIITESGVEYDAPATISQQRHSFVESDGNWFAVEEVSVDIRVADVPKLKEIPYHGSVKIRKWGLTYTVSDQNSTRDDTWLRLLVVREPLSEEVSLRRSP